MTCAQFREKNINIEFFNEDSTTRAERSALGNHFRGCESCKQWIRTNYSAVGSQEEVAEAWLQGVRLAMKDFQDPEAH